MNEKRVEIVSGINAAREKIGARDEKEEIPKPSRPIRVGDLVEIPGTRSRAEVAAVKGDKLQLRAGVLSMTVKADEVRLIEDDERAALRKSEKKQAAAAVRSLRTDSARAELDIRGLESLEAESVVENYLDSALRAHLESVTIIHGKGTGALRKAVHALLRKNRCVKSFRLGDFGEGDAGVTIVTLK